MGQCESKDWELYIQVLKAMLKTRGSRVRSLQLMQFLDFVQDTCPWFPGGGHCKFRNREQGRRQAEGTIYG
jgi:hypothetical protein